MQCVNVFGLCHGFGIPLTASSTVTIGGSGEYNARGAAYLLVWRTFVGPGSARIGSLMHHHHYQFHQVYQEQGVSCDYQVRFM